MIEGKLVYNGVLGKPNWQLAVEGKLAGAQCRMLMMEADKKRN